ncbi:hypothetical protein LAZ67_X000730 [Cordylochernes scorpioides]|uniref:DUF5641 domain-containing protein n=1 Tax=Cordylochernes scorpioides TaxID=51811 RepID=A0ABY6LRV6_9ARAC|nr:hypothetical protein LAZ67_X000730 [Cordylochernes scorpioides]
MSSGTAVPTSRGPMGRLSIIPGHQGEILLDDPRSTEAQINDEMEQCETYSLQVGIVAQKVKEYESKLAASCDDKMQWELDKKGITLTKVDNNKTEIDILIGGDYYGQLLTGKIEQLAGGLTAIQTVLGWTLIGNTSSERPETSAQMVITLLTTQQRVASLWELETIGIRDPTEVISVKEKNVLMQEKFREKICRGHDGRYLVSLPWKEGIGTIPNNLEIAKRRLEAMTQKSTQKGQFVPYDEVFRSWFRENLIEEVDGEDIRPIGHYLPQRPIYKVQSETTPIRPVYDASCKASKRSLSLNECLETGPDLIELLPEILIRFREKKIGAIADIRKAFQTVGIDEKERSHKEYLAMLVQKGNETEGRRFHPGEVVLIGRDDQKRIFWPLGRILELYPGKDGRERVARVRTATDNEGVFLNTSQFQAEEVLIDARLGRRQDDQRVIIQASPEDPVVQVRGRCMMVKTSRMRGLI